MVDHLWKYEVQELTKLRPLHGKPSIDVRFRQRVAARRRLEARSTRPWRRRPAPAGSLTWPVQSGWPDLISLCAELSK